MPIQLKLAFILAAAILAAAANHRYVSSQIQVEQFVAARAELEMGHHFTHADLSPIQLGGDVDLASLSLVPWGERSLLLGQPAARTIRAGELLMRSDTESIIRPVRADPRDYVFTVKTADLGEFAGMFQIGEPVLFVLGSPVTNGKFAEKECGPFTVRALGVLSVQLDPAAMSKLKPTTITLSAPRRKDGGPPASVNQLLDVLSRRSDHKIVALRHVNN
jgi:hypothetical protein